MLLRISKVFAFAFLATMVVVLGPRLTALGYVNLGSLMLVRVWSVDPTVGMYSPERGVPASVSLMILTRVQQYYHQALLLNSSVSYSIMPVLAHLYSLTGDTHSLALGPTFLARDVDGRADLSALALGFSYLRAGQKERAKQVWSGRGSGIADYFAHRGDALLNAVDRRQAYSYYRIARAIRPNDPALDMRLILAGFMTDQKDLAWREMNALIEKIAPQEFAEEAARLHATVNDAFIWVLVAASDAYQSRGDIRTAEFMLLRAYSIQPDPISISRLGAFYCRQGRLRDGVEVLDKAKAYGSQYYALESRQQLSICYCRNGRRDDAMREAEELARMAPMDSEFKRWSMVLAQDWQRVCAT